MCPRRNPSDGRYVEQGIKTSSIMIALTTYFASTNSVAITWITIIGAFAFGISGGLAAVRGRLDIFGVMVLAATVGLAGGVLRDLLLGIRPSSIYDWRVIVAVALAGITAFVLRGPLIRWSSSIEAFDAVGLSLFCVIGTDVALQHHATPVTAVLLGTVTAVGGGAVRDVLLNRVPAVLREGLYAVPAMIGSTVIVVGYEIDRINLAWYFLAGGLCLIIRVVGMVFRVNLPVAPVPGAPRQSADPQEGGSSF